MATAVMPDVYRTAGPGVWRARRRTSRVAGRVTRPPAGWAETATGPFAAASNHDSRPRRLPAPRAQPVVSVSCRCGRRLSSRWAAAASARGCASQTIGRTRPSAIIGQMCARTPATTAPFSADRRARRLIAVTLARLRRSVLRFSSALVPPCMPMTSSRPSSASAATFAARPLAPMLSRMTSAPCPSVAFLSCSANRRRGSR